VPYSRLAPAPRSTAIQRHDWEKLLVRERLNDFDNGSEAITSVAARSKQRFVQDVHLTMDVVSHIDFRYL
jgi:hypothetical protein